MAAIRGFFRVQKCMHPEAAPSVCGKVINAHTIQRSAVLRRIIDSTNHVLTFHPLACDKDGNSELHRRGWKDASVFTGFCR
jgi:hypothetical protein